MYRPFVSCPVNGGTGYYRQSLFDNNYQFLYDRLLSIINFDNMPEEWDKGYFLNELYTVGYIGLFVPQEGQLKGVALCNGGTMSGRNAFDRPNKFRSYKSDLFGFEGTIGVDCTVLRTDENYRPMREYITYYAHRLALIDTSLEMSLINSRVAYAVAAKDKASAKTIADLMDKVYRGQPAVTYDARLGANENREDGDNWNIQLFEPDHAFLADKLSELRKEVINEYDRIIGIPVQADKKERVITSEQEAINVATSCQATNVIECLNKYLTQANKILGTNIKASIRTANPTISTESEVDDGI